ncbi:MAG: Rhs family protein, partial [Candidatus Rifleibacterium amylolyticum]
SEASYTWNSDNRLIKVETAIGGCKHDKDRKGFGYGHLKHGKETVVYEEYTYLPQDWRRVSRKAGKYSVNTDHKSKLKKEGGEEQDFISIYDGDDESHEYLLTAAKTHLHGKHNHGKESLKLFREFVGGPAADDIAHTRYGKLSFAMLKDGLGSTVALAGRDGKVIAHIGYDAWGNFRYEDKLDKAPCKDDELDDYLDRLEGTRSFGHGNHNGWAFGKHFGSKLTPYLFTGRRYSAFTGQYNNRNRYYSPALGRFVSKDPISFSGGYNLYRYVDNNPIIGTDPYGLIWIPTWTSYIQTNVSPRGYRPGNLVRRLLREDKWSYVYIWSPVTPACLPVGASSGKTGISTRYVVITDHNLLLTLLPLWPYSTTVQYERALAFKYSNPTFREYPVP